MNALLCTPSSLGVYFSLCHNQPCTIFWPFDLEGIVSIAMGETNVLQYMGKIRKTGTVIYRIRYSWTRIREIKDEDAVTGWDTFISISQKENDAAWMSAPAAAMETT